MRKLTDKSSKGEFRTSSRLPLLTLRMLGLHMYHHKVAHWFFYLNNMCLVLSLVAEWMFIVQAVSEGRSIVYVSNAMMCTGFSMMSEVKMTAFYLKRKTVTKISFKLEQLFPKQLSNDRENAIVGRSIWFLKLVINSTVYMNAVLITLFNLYPLVPMINSLVIEGTTDLKLPYFMAYPFDTSVVEFWAVAFFQQQWGGLVSAVGIVCTDCYFILCCAYICLYFRLLSDRIRHTKISTQSETGLTGDGQVYALGDSMFVRMRLFSLIEYHQELISLCHDLESAYAIPTLFNFVVSSIIICMNCFIITVLKNAQAFNFLFALTTTTLQVFILCFFGDMLMYSSSEISEAVYNVDWYSADLKTKKIYLFMLMSSQRPCKLTAHKFFIISLNSFTKIISTSSSYFALLRTVYEPKLDDEVM